MTAEDFRNPPIDVAGYDPTRDVRDCIWDDKSREDAKRACEFFPVCLSHVKGFSGPFNLLPWQRDWIATLFGWRRPDGTRRYRENLCAVPRKNGKTAICAGLSLYCLLADGVRGAEVYSAAFSRDQATLVFEPAAGMVRANKHLSNACKIVDSTKRITVPGTSSFYRALPADAANTHGFSASAVIFDELHTQPHRDLYDVLKTSQGSRALAAQQSGRGGPLFISITTAGHDRNSICWEVWDYARQVRDGIIEDPYFLPVIYELREDEDWSDKEVWRRVNPSYGVSISEEYLADAFARAQQIPATENTFRNLHLNQWTQQEVRLIPMDLWDRCGGEAEQPPNDAECWAGLDLSATTDLSALTLVFPLPDGRVNTKCFFWVPGDSARRRGERDRVEYEQWIKDGHITATPGASVDYEYIRRDIKRLGEQYNIRQIGIDRWNATQLAKQLESDGFKVGYHGQGYASMSSPTKALLGLIVDGKVLHGGNPVLRWMANNVAAEQDAAGNIKPSKAKSTERIDGIVSLIMALGVMAGDQGGGDWIESELGL